MTFSPHSSLSPFSPLSSPAAWAALSTGAPPTSSHSRPPSTRRRLRILARLRRSQLEHAAAELSRALKGEKPGQSSVLFVLGCQRSGTTLMTEFFEADPEAKVYPEHSSLSARDTRHRLRLDSLERVASALERSRFPRIVLKPLVESQRARELLTAVPGSRALWMFRDWRDVARSNLARFGPGNGLRNLRFVAERCKDDWRSEGVDDEVVSVVSRAYREDMRPYDAAALFWWVRNSHFFAQALGEEPRVRLCRYEDLVADPAAEMRRVYAFMGETMPGDLGFSRVSRDSLGLGGDIDVSPEVARLCDDMHGRLLAAHREAA